MLHNITHCEHRPMHFTLPDFISWTGVTGRWGLLHMHDFMLLDLVWCCIFISKADFSSQ